MPRPGFKQRPKVRRAPILSGLVVVALSMLAPSALAEPADDQYNFNPPNPGGDGGESSSGGSPTSGSDTGAGGGGGTGLAGVSANAADDGSGKDGKASGTEDGSGAAPGSTISTIANPSDDGSGTSDESALSAVTDSLGLGVMPILLAAMAAIAIGGVSLALYRRRERAGTEAV